MIKHLFQKYPTANYFLSLLRRKFFRRNEKFNGSKNYWIERYTTGKDSGPGSYGKFAEFKAETLNGFIDIENIQSVIEYGCGDGNQLSLSNYPSYIGFDISQDAISRCKNRFGKEDSKSFYLMSEFKGTEKAELTLSLDVVYHLIEDAEFNEYMVRLFDTSEKFTVIYSSNSDELVSDSPHVRHRRFSSWVEKNRPQWQLKKIIPNKFPYNGDYKNSSFADFYIYYKAGNTSEVDN